MTSTVPPDLSVNAEYLPGDAARPALLLLHGFLQTNEFLSTKMMVDGLAGLGYTVLAPNLSLGIKNRRQSLQCEAPHTRTLGGDLHEIDHWVAWLRERGHSSVILIGHSYGSQHAIAYADTFKAPVEAIIAVSLTNADNERLEGEVGEARARLDRGDRTLQPYRLGFCQRFMATAESYLSYAELGRQDGALGRLRARGVPVYVIAGGDDRRIDADWLQSLRELDVEVTVIEGANHFFSSIYEFELIERVESILGALRGPAVAGY